MAKRTTKRKKYVMTAEHKARIKAGREAKKNLKELMQGTAVFEHTENKGWDQPTQSIYPEEPYFPIVIKFCHTEEIQIIKSAEHLPKATAFVILKSNWD